MKLIFIVVLGLALLGVSNPAAAQLGPPDRISVLTMGPGDHPFARFGHNAILAEWPRERRTLVYNFGTFAFDGMNGVRDFMNGHFRYWLSVSTLPRTLAFYSRQRRGIVAQELELDAHQRAALADALEQNAEPEKREYDYDYYRDNCSTRVRDAVDQVVAGELSRQIKNKPGRLSFREHTERLTAGVPWLYFALDLALGPLTDRPTQRWEELFIPSELHDALATVTLANEPSRHLVRAERVLLEDPRPPLLRDPPSRAPFFAAAGLALGALLLALGHFAVRSRAARAAFGLLTAFSGLLLGLLGCVFCFFWFFTKHWSAYRNENILVCPPWALPLVVLGLGVASGRWRESPRLKWLFAAVASGAALALLFALVPGFGQDNTRIAGLFGPLWIGAYLGYCRYSGFAPWPLTAPRSHA
jgi:hypothetical protein